MNKNQFVVIMAGGVGSRFWPYSRNNKPKQFLDILGVGKSLLRITFERFLKIVPPENVYVVTNDIYADLVKEELPEISDYQILGEPQRRNTAPCIAYASHKIVKENEDAVVVVSPSDHMILDEASFFKTINSAIEGASAQDKLITIGLKAHRPETGFGYIQFLESDSEMKPVKTFTEKPAEDLAQKFIESGDFVWNSGIFIWGIQAILKAYQECLPEMNEIFEDYTSQLGTEAEAKAVNSIYSQVANISIDYGVMEKASNVFTVLGDFGWSDLGSWNALYDLSEKDEDGNVINANALTYNTSNTYIKANKDKLVVVQGLEDYLVTECDNILLICKKNDEQKFRDFVADVKKKKGKNYL